MTKNRDLMGFPSAFDGNYLQFYGLNDPFCNGCVMRSGLKFVLRPMGQTPFDVQNNLGWGKYVP